MITNIYVLICTGIFVYINFINKEDKTYCALKLGAFYPPNVRDKKEYWRFIMCNFIHIDFLHFLLNVYALYDLGHFFESLLGSWAYLYLIVISMTLSSLMCYSVSLVAPQYDNTITLGASGVVFGFFGAICALGVIVGGAYMQLLQSFFYVILMNVLFTIFNRGVSKAGHIGGFIGGVVGIVLLLAFQIL